MNRKIKVLTILFFCNVTPKLHAQVVQKISLQQAIELSIKNNHTLTIDSAKILSATADVQEAKDRQLPDAKVSASYLRLGAANIDLKGSAAGGPKVNQALYGSANISLPLYTGGKIKYGIASAKLLEEAAKLNGTNDEVAVVFNSIQAYTNLYKAHKTVSVIKETLASSKQRDATFSRLEQNGLLARNDLLKSQLQTSNIELTLLDAENNLNMANINMALMLGLTENTLIEIDTNFVDAKQELKPFIQYENLALQNRKDIKAIGIQKKAADIGVKASKADAYPNIALTGGYIAADIPTVLTITNAINIGIGVHYNIASLWKSNTKLQKAKANIIQLNATELMLNDGIRLQINKDYQNYLLTKKKIEVYENAIAQATENYRITKNKYDNSLVNLTDLLEADVSLLQTKLNVAVAKADAALAYNKLLETTGTLSK
jgi:outer membrane protein